MLSRAWFKFALNYIDGLLLIQVWHLANKSKVSLLWRYKNVCSIRVYEALENGRIKDNCNFLYRSHPSNSKY